MYFFFGLTLSFKHQDFTANIFRSFTEYLQSIDNFYDLSVYGE